MPDGPWVLVAEDDADMRRLVCCMLRRAGFRAVGVRNVMEAIERIAPAVPADRKPFDAIVSDVRMPGLSGLDLLALLRCASVELPVIVLSAFNDEATRAEARGLGAVAVLDKPVDPDLLATTVESAMDRRTASVA